MGGADVIRKSKTRGVFEPIMYSIQMANIFL